MRRIGIWIPLGLLAAVALTLWGVWTYRLASYNQELAAALEAERQRDFNEAAYHVEQIDTLLGKGLVTGSVTQNMRYMADANRHATAAVDALTSLPLPAQMSATTGKFLQQVGDFALSLLRNEAAGRPMTARERAELTRLRQESAELRTQMSQMLAEYNQSSFRWHPPLEFSLQSLAWRPATLTKPPTQDQAPSSLLPSGWDQVAVSMEQMPQLIYDGPFSDHIDQAAPAMTGPAVTQEEAAAKLPAFFPEAAKYSVSVGQLEGNLPAYSFRLTPADARDALPTATVAITKSGGHLLQLLNSRTVGQTALDLAQARTIGQEYLAAAGFPNMVPTFGQVQDGTATIAYAARENGVMIYPDQVKVKVALDNGEVLGVDARQYLMYHKERQLPAPGITVEQAQEQVNPDLQVLGRRLALIPDLAGTGETLTYEFLGKLGGETYLVYINAETGHEEQILQLIETEGGTLTL